MSGNNENTWAAVGKGVVYVGSCAAVIGGLIWIGYSTYNSGFNRGQVFGESVGRKESVETQKQMFDDGKVFGRFSCMVYRSGYDDLKTVIRGKEDTPCRGLEIVVDDKQKRTSMQHGNFRIELPLDGNTPILYRANPESSRPWVALEAPKQP